MINWKKHLDPRLDIISTIVIVIIIINIILLLFSSTHSTKLKRKLILENDNKQK